MLTEEHIKSIKSHIAESLNFNRFESHEDTEEGVLGWYLEIEADKLPQGRKLIRAQKKMIKAARKMDKLETKIWEAIDLERD